MQSEEKQISLPFSVSKSQLRVFCKRWNIEELSVFGSAARNDFDVQRSDIDILVSFSEDTEWTLTDEIQMQRELKKILGREVDLVSRNAIEKSENWIRRDAILKEAQTIYAA